MSSIAAHQCCITYQNMTDPVIDADGHTYEREAIVQWLRIHSTSPMTRRSMTIDELRPNRAVRDAISELRGTSNSATVVFPMEFYYLALLPAKDKEFPYSIHGLWLQEGAHKWRACPKGGNKFDIERLRVLLPELRADWHSSRGTDEHFWKHEWEKHAKGLTEVEYFQKTLDCFEKVKANGKEWAKSNRFRFIFFTKLAPCMGCSPGFVFRSCPSIKKN